VTLSELSNRNEGLLNVALLLLLGPPEVFLGLLQVGLSVCGSIVDSRIRREADLLDRVGRGSRSSTLLGWVLVTGVAVLVIDAAAAVAAASGRVLARDRCLRMFPLATVVALVVRQRTRRRRRLVVHGG